MVKVASLLGMLAFMTSALSQTPTVKPDFSGRWVEESRPKPHLVRLGFCPKECVITQNSEAIVVKSVDGTRSTDLMKPMVRTDTSNAEVSVTVTVKSAWEGGTLVITSSYKENTRAETTLTSTVRLTFREDRLVISGIGNRPGTGAFDYEHIYKRQEPRP